MTSTALPDTADFAPFLPGLHRYARLLMGQQLLADGMVMDAIERTAAETTAQGGNDDHRLHLYREVTRSWRAAIADRIGGCRTSYALAADADDDLRSLNSVARAAFLLVTVERFSNVAAARILDTTCGALQALLAEASIAVSKHAPTEVLIIEDELLIAFELEDIMTRLGHVVTSVVRSHRLAIKQARVRRPQLILADINLADGSSGIDAVTEIIGDDSVPVVWTYPVSVDS